MASNGDVRKRVEEQVEEIIDEGSGPTRSVIVRVAEPDDAVEALIGTATDAMRIRALALTARDVLPETFAKLREKKPAERTAGDRRAFAQERASAVAQVAAADFPKSTKRRLIESGDRALRPLLEHDIAKRSLESADKRRPSTIGQPVFRASRSVLLDLKPEELKQLTSEVDTVADCYPNRTLRVPAVVEAKSLPQRAADNKASAWGIYRIGAMSAWGAYNARGRNVTVGVLDTGIDPVHPDLQGKIAAWAEFDSNGEKVRDSEPHDTDQHGTHVAGTIVGGNASGRWIGVAPDAKVAAAMVLDGKKGGTDAQVLAGIDWALEQGVHVISMSLGGLTLDQEAPSAYTAAILTSIRAGVPVVVSIGNEGGQTSGNPGNDLFAFSVGATDPEDRCAGFSGGRTQIIFESSFISDEFLPLPYSKPEVSAPGVAVQSSVPRGKWANLSGTSMAAPHVSGALAVILSATNGLRTVPAEERAFLLQDLLIGSVEELGESGQDHRFGFGRIDVLRAIGFAREQGF
jgi:subtilisin family serine protease